MSVLFYLLSLSLFVEGGIWNSRHAIPLSSSFITDLKYDFEKSLYLSVLVTYL